MVIGRFVIGGAVGVVVSATPRAVAGDDVATDATVTPGAAVGARAPDTVPPVEVTVVGVTTVGERCAVVDGAGGGHTAVADAGARGGGSDAFAAPAGCQRHPSTTAGVTVVVPGPAFEYDQLPARPCQ